MWPIDKCIVNAIGVFLKSSSVPFQVKTMLILDALTRTIRNQLSHNRPLVEYEQERPLPFRPRTPNCQVFIHHVPHP